MDRFTPIPADQDGFQQAALSGTMSLRDLVAVPAGANCAWLQADSDIQFRMNGETAGAAALLLSKGAFLPLSNPSMLNGLVLIGNATLVVQFGMGTVGAMPPAPTAMEGGGGGGGGVTSVSATLPLTSTGGDTPNVSIAPGSSMSVLQWSGSAWDNRTAQVGRSVFVDNVVGNDATGQAYNPLRPFLSFAAALAASIAGDTIVLRTPGTYDASAEIIAGRNVIGDTALLTGPVRITGNVLLRVQQVTGDLLVGSASNLRVNTVVTGALNKVDPTNSCVCFFSGTVHGLVILTGNMHLRASNSNFPGGMFTPAVSYGATLEATGCTIGSPTLDTAAIWRSTSHGTALTVRLDKCILLSASGAAIASSANLIHITTRDTVAQPNVISGGHTLVAENSILGGGPTSQIFGAALDMSLPWANGGGGQEPVDGTDIDVAANGAYQVIITGAMRTNAGGDIPQFGLAVPSGSVMTGTANIGPATEPQYFNAGTGTVDGTTGAHLDVTPFSISALVYTNTNGGRIQLTAAALGGTITLYGATVTIIRCR